MRFALVIVAMIGVVAVIVVAIATPPACAVDLSKIERVIDQEPAYVGQPLYALLVFGTKAAKRVWLVVDGETVYLDRNGNGDLTETDERVPLDVAAKQKINIGGSSRGEFSGMNCFELGEVAGCRLRYQVWVRRPDFVPKDESSILSEFRQARAANGWENSTLWRITAEGKPQAQNPIVLCPRPQDSQIAHLDGPLTFTLKWHERQKLQRGAVDQIFDVNIGTPGLAPRNCDHVFFSPLTTDEIPVGLHPQAHFQFPHKDTAKPPIQFDVALDQRCCGDTAYAALRVPAEAATGKATVLLSFPGWNERQVTPAAFEVTVEDAPAAEATQ